MGYAVTVAQAITRSQQRCDKENDLSISAAEWQTLVAAAYGELYLIVAESGMRFFESVYLFSGPAPGTGVSLPSDHLSTIGIDRILDAQNNRVPLIEIMVQERSRWLGITGDATHYSIGSGSIELYGSGSVDDSYEMLYIPQPTDFSTGSTSAQLECVTPDGVEFLIWSTCVKAMHKSESDVQLAIAEREAARMRLEEWATLRAFNTPRRRFVQGNDNEMGYMRGPWDAADWWNR